MKEFINTLEQDVIKARDIRILSCIAVDGADAIPYDFEFLNKYNLKTPFFTFLDAKTQGGKGQGIINKHIKSSAQYNFTTEELLAADKILLSIFSKWGFQGLATIFKDSPSSLLRMLEEYEMLSSYLIFNNTLKDSFSTTQMIENAKHIESIAQTIAMQTLTLI